MYIIQFNTACIMFLLCAYDAGTFENGKNTMDRPPAYAKIVNFWWKIVKTVAN